MGRQSYTGLPVRDSRVKKHTFVANMANRIASKTRLRKRRIWMAWTNTLSSSRAIAL
jgi:hypothetical protein